MAKISRSDDDKLLVDGKPLNTADYALDDEDLASASGGVQVYQKFSHGRSYLECGCGSRDFDIIGRHGGGTIECKCQVCGVISTMYGDSTIED